RSAGNGPSRRIGWRRKRRLWRRSVVRLDCAGNTAHFRLGDWRQHRRALTAPFAFLGSAYDTQLRAVYTGLSPRDVLTTRLFTAALFSDAMADNAPLYKTISRYLDERMMADIATAYDQGRLLL